MKATSQIIENGIGYRICLDSRRSSCSSQHFEQSNSFLVSVFVTKYIFHVTCYQTYISNGKIRNRCSYKELLF